jgi:hypothetical protein
VGKTAVVRESIDWPFEAPEDIEIRSFGGERHGRSRQRSLAIESGAPEHSAGQKVSDGFQRKVLTQTKFWTTDSCEL